MLDIVRFASRSSAHHRIRPPDDTEMWSYIGSSGRGFVRFSSLSRISLGAALVFLSFKGNWLMLLAPFGAGVVLSGLINLVWSTQVRAFSKQEHALRCSLSSSAPSVDVFICTCGEDAEVVANTIAHATALEHDGNVTVYVLDDRHSEEIAAAADLHGARYLARPDRGWMKKAGNLRHGYERSEGDLILVLDADFAVRPDFLRHTVAYFDDPDLGILQTPQFFRVSSNNWVERGAAAQQEQFYRVGMRARDAHGGAICVGTNALYRRAALDERGGMALLEHSEDIFTGMKIVDAGYRVDYLPLPLAAGSAPDSAEALASQQYRWARGNFALAGTPLFKRMRLSPMQRLGLWDGWIYYLTSALSPLVALFVPIVTLAEAPSAITLAPTAMVLPALFTEFVLQPRWLHLPDGRASRRVGLISQVAHLHALRDHLRDRDQEWVPTGGFRGGDARRKQGTARIPEHISAAALWGFAATLVLLGVRVATGWPIVDLAPVAVLGAIALPAALGVTRPAEVPRKVTVNGRRPGDRQQPVATLDLTGEPTIVLPDATAGEGRDGLLDLIRTASVIRVMCWHAFAFWWISWLFAAMPAVFYVSGAVLSESMRRRGAWPVVRARLRRLLPPFAAFAAVAIAVETIRDPDVWRTHLADIASWVVPYRAPAPLPWEGGWLSTPLWFIRALVLVLALVPLVAPVLRRIPWWLSASSWALSLVAVDRLVAGSSTDLTLAVWRGIGDVVCFGGFFAIGCAGHRRRDRLTHATRGWLACVLGAASVGWALAFPPLDGVVNNSFVLFALVGMAWLAVVLFAEDHLRHIASIAPIKRFVGWFNERSMTIYLWHTLAIVLAFSAIGAPRALGEHVVWTAAFAVILPLVVASVRRIGSARHDRTARLRAVAPTLAAVAVLGILATQPTLFPTFPDEMAPPPPSGRPAPGVVVTTPEATAAERAAMSRSAQAWIDGHDVDSVAAVEIGPSTRNQSVAVQFGDADALDAAAPFEALSITKSMVAAVALQLVDEGVLTLDGALPPVEGVDTRVTEALTLRRLLSHATGLPDYRRDGDFRPDMILTPADAIALVVDDADLASTVPEYSATNYLLAGSVIERVTGRSLDAVLEERLFGPLGMEDTQLVDNRREGFIGQASGGVVSTLADLARWYDGLMRSGTVLSDEMREEMVFGGQRFQGNAGLGAWRHCPCDLPTAARPEPYLYVFHDGGDSRVVYIPSRDTVVAMRLSKGLYETDRIADDLVDLTFAIVDRREIATG
jgi:cellulose synthase (UDP-forming)